MRFLFGDFAFFPTSESLNPSSSCSVGRNPTSFLPRGSASLRCQFISSVVSSGHHFAVFPPIVLLIFQAPSERFFFSSRCRSALPWVGRQDCSSCASKCVYIKPRLSSRWAARHSFSPLNNVGRHQDFSSRWNRSQLRGFWARLCQNWVGRDAWSSTCGALSPDSSCRGWLLRAFTTLRHRNIWRICKICPVISK